MPRSPLTWQQELAIVDRTMKAISGIVDPDKLVETYWRGIGDLLPVVEHVALSRRHVEPPFYLITRSSRFTEHPNPWTERDRLPRLKGGILGQLAYANQPVIIDDLPRRLAADDPGLFYLQGYERLVAFPQYDGGEGLNVMVMLQPPGSENDPSKLPIMHWHAGLFGRGTQNLVLRNQLATALAALDRELQIVGEIQRSLLPTELPSIPGFELAASYQTSSRAGGDYYDFFPLDGGALGVFIADVAGHGTPAAVLMAITHAIAHAQPGTHAPPNVLLEYLNRQLTHSYTRNGAFVTAFYAVLDPWARTLIYSRAGHNPPLLLRGGQVLSLDKNGALPLGIFEGQDYEQSNLTLESGNLIMLYTDGIAEARSSAAAGEEPELFGTDRISAVLLDSLGASPDEVINRLQSAISEFSGHAPPVDDQTLLAIRCL